MEFEIYCDESGLEALTRKDAHQFIAIGGIWIPASYRNTLKETINAIKSKHKVHGEFKWGKLSPKFYDFYKEIIDYFCASSEIRARVIIIESSLVDNVKFNEKDAELSFYKFYYQLLHHWILDFNDYDIFLDYKLNRNKGRLNELKTVLNASNITSEINHLQAIHSQESLGIQLADLITGLVAAKFNGKTTSQAKFDLVHHLETTIGRIISPSPKAEEKLNIFKINLQGGW